MTKEHENYLRDIAQNLPKVHKGVTRMSTRKVQGNQMTNRMIQAYQALYNHNGGEGEWKPNPQGFYFWSETHEDLVDHFQNLVKEFKQGGVEAVKAYSTSAKNMAAIQTATANEAKRINNQKPEENDNTGEN